MSEIRVVKEVGSRIIMMRNDGTPQQILKCFVKEGRYGRFLSIEKHWVQEDKETFMDSRWARWTVTIPFDRDKAIRLVDMMKELIEEAFKTH